MSVDLYLNETNRHAHVVLPATSPLEQGHYPLATMHLSIRNVAHYTPPVLAQTGPPEWKTLARLADIAAGGTGDHDPHELAQELARFVLRTAGRPGGPLAGRDLDDVLAQIRHRGPEMVLDAIVRTGPYGDQFGTNDGGLTLDRLEDEPHGIDLGPLQPRLPEVLRTPSGYVEAAPPLIVSDVERLRQRLDHPAPPFVLIGRRELRSNNSWMHNIDVLVRGRRRCTLLINPQDAARLGLTNGDPARVTSTAGAIVAPVEITETLRHGVVSLPHGWGHDRPGSGQRTAATTPGINTNLLTPSDLLDPLSGTSVLNGIPVDVSPIHQRSDIRACQDAGSM